MRDSKNWIWEGGIGGRGRRGLKHQTTPTPNTKQRKPNSKFKFQIPEKIQIANIQWNACRVFLGWSLELFWHVGAWNLNFSLALLSRLLRDDGLDDLAATSVRRSRVAIVTIG